MNTKAFIVQYADEAKTLPDGSKLIYAESDDRIILYHKLPLEKGLTYIYFRKTGDVTINNKPGTATDKRKMIQLGKLFLQHSTEDELITINISDKELA